MGNIDESGQTGPYAAVMADYRLLTARPPAEAVILVGALQSEGLRVLAERNGLGAVYGLTSGGFGTGVLVHVDDFERARELVVAMEAPHDR